MHIETMLCDAVDECIDVKLKQTCQSAHVCVAFSGQSATELLGVNCK